MKHFKNLFLALACLFAGAANATDCTSTIAYLTTYNLGTSTPTLYVATTAGVGFYLLMSDPNAKMLFNQASQAKMMGEVVTLSFSGAASCNTVNWRSDLFALHY